MNLLSFTTLLRSSAAAVQAACAQLLDLSVGSVLRAVLEANASVALWLQWLILQVLALTRAATSNGADLDSWMADFSVTRLPAVAASGNVTFARFTPTDSALVAVGTTVLTADGTQAFAVYANPGNGAWNGTLGGYVIAASVASVTVPVAAVVAGIGGNVQASTITLIASGIAGVDTVTNGSAFTTGVDAETDAALRARFWNFLATRAQATDAAVGYAIASVQQGLSWTIANNVNPDSSSHPGFSTITVDDGTGSPSDGVLAAVTAAIVPVIGLGYTFTVQGPSCITANVGFTLTAAPGYVKGNLLAPAETAVTAFINALPMGAALPWSRLAQVVYDSTPGVGNVTGMLANAGTADLGGGTAQVVRAGTVTAS